MNKLKKVREKTGLSQTELSKASGVNVRMIQKYEQGVKSIDGAKIATLAALALALDCRISEILEKPETIKGARL